jgi:hypothetical protein
MSKFSQAMGLIDEPLIFEDVVATQFSELWTE